MPTIKKTKALLDAEKRIKELEDQLKNEKSRSEMWCKSSNEKEEIINGLHDILDDMGIRGYRDGNKYQRIPLAVRLFAWSMGTILKK